ncbi:uncharacterized protein LOC122049282 [Zingiber officinale]|uniref:uncharacterized protein LOC122049282 n=1 Tax=Zingiber officinale TaxID=94328 RepID=UPI001C4D9948|nr:uncharacterized protein LOC122049282 [Zingiber officinale]
MSLSLASSLDLVSALDMDGGDATSSASPSSPRPFGVGADGEERLGSRDEGCDALASAIASTLGAVMREFDSRAESAGQSQDELVLSLDCLTGELDKLLEDAPLPFIMQYAMRISTIRKRVSALNFTLKTIQRRIDNMDQFLSMGIPTSNHQPTEQPHH